MHCNGCLFWNRLHRCLARSHLSLLFVGLAYFFSVVADCWLRMRLSCMPTVALPCQLEWLCTRCNISAGVSTSWTVSTFYVFGSSRGFWLGSRLSLWDGIRVTLHRCHLLDQGTDIGLSRIGTSNVMVERHLQSDDNTVLILVGWWVMCQCANIINELRGI